MVVSSIELHLSPLSTAPLSVPQNVSRETFYLAEKKNGCVKVNCVLRSEVSTRKSYL